MAVKTQAMRQLNGSIRESLLLEEAGLEQRRTRREYDNSWIEISNGCLNTVNGGID